MIFHQVTTPGIAHSAYLIGDAGEVVIVDPRRDVDEYLELVAASGASVRYVLETHRQEDFVIGSSELARRTGASVVNGIHPLFGRGDLRLAEGDELRVGRLRLRALHTPGHTPESMSYALYSDDIGDVAWGVLTGDALLFGTTGRTDLTDPERTRENAGILHDSIHDKILPLGDQALIFPAHGAGSVCGTGIAARDRSTIGLERAYNPVFTSDRDAYMDHMASHRIPRPPTFARMEEWNLEGGRPLARSAFDLSALDPARFEERARGGIVIDAREPEAFAGGHIEGALSVWMSGLGVFGGWIADESTPVYLVLERDSDRKEAFLALARIGVDRVEGVLAGGMSAWRRSGRSVERSATITPRELADHLDEMVLLDVREDEEFEKGHVGQAIHVYVGQLEERVARVADALRDRKVAVTCSVGHRSGLGTSMLLRQGIKDVANVLGGMTAWNELDLPVEEGEEREEQTVERALAPS